MNDNELRHESYEHGLPPYLQHELDMFKDLMAKGETCRTSLDMMFLWGELYGSINTAQEDEITMEHAQYLRDKFLF